MHTALILGTAIVALTSVASAASCPGVPTAKYPFRLAAGWKAATVASGLKSPRDLVIDTKGRLLIVQSGKGISQHVVGSNGCITSSKMLVSNTALNHGIYLSPDGNTLYASTPTTVYRWTYQPTTGAVQASPDTIVMGMNNGGHTTRTLIIPRNHPELLVVSHGSDGNLDANTINPATARAIVKVFNLNTIPPGGYNFVTGGYNAGFGLRNEVGLAFDGSNMLWGVENSADDLTRTPQGGQTYSVVKDNPAEELNFLGDVSMPNNRWYGYPRCFSVGKPSAFTDRVFTVSEQFVQAPNAQINDTSCVGRSTPARLTFPAHTAPLGAKFDAKFTNLYVTLHGSWDRNPPQGYKMVAVPFKKTGTVYQPVASATNAAGFTNIFYPPNENTCSGSTCARPVGLVFDAAGRLYMTSDASGEVFLLLNTAA